MTEQEIFDNMILEYKKSIFCLLEAYEDGKLDNTPRRVPSVKLDALCGAAAWMVGYLSAIMIRDQIAREDILEYKLSVATDVYNEMLDRRPKTPCLALVEKDGEV